jgi:hypothetical protein
VNFRELAAGVLEVGGTLLRVGRHDALDQTLEGARRHFRRQLQDAVERDGERVVAQVENLVGERPLRALEVGHRAAEIEGAPELALVDAHDARRAADFERRDLVLLLVAALLRLRRLDAVSPDHDEGRLRLARDLDRRGARGRGGERQAQALVEQLALVGRDDAEPRRVREELGERVGETRPDPVVLALVRRVLEGQDDDRVAPRLRRDARGGGEQRRREGEREREE